jgi:hypothetical protein
MAVSASVCTRRSRLALAALAGFLLAVVASSTARADPYGELKRVSVASTGLTFTEQTSAFGVDPATNDIYVGEEVPSTTPGEPSGKYRILRFDSSGNLLAKSHPLNPSGKSPLGIEGIGIDHASHRVYVLGLFERSAGEKLIDAEEAAAGTLYALNSETLASEVPGTLKKEEEGVLATPETLHADGKVAGEALLNPHGIAVDPTTHDVVMLGEVDTGTPEATQRHVALERVSSVGALLSSRYVDPAVELEAPVDSPVVTVAGEVLAERRTGENLEQIIQFPHTEGSPSVVFEFPAKTSGPEELVEALEPETVPVGRGAELALASEAGAGGVLYSDAEVAEDVFGANGLEVKHVFPGSLLINFQDVAGTVTTSERGWTGGANALTNAQAKCVIAEHEGEYPLVGAASEGRLFVLDAPTAQVVEFGPGGEGCPHAAAPAMPAIEVTDANGVPLTSAAAGEQVTFSTLVVQGNVFSSVWNFGDGTPVQTSTEGEYQLAEAHHTYSASATALATLLEGEGKTGGSLTVKEGAAVKDATTLEHGVYTVAEKIKTDDLATPELTVQRALSVETPAQASGHVTYKIYTDPACSTPLPSVQAQTVEVNAGAVPPSEEHILPPGTYYWQDAYTGDATHAPSISACVAEVVKGLQAIAFTSTAPAHATVGGPTYTVTAQGGGSGQPVTFSSGSSSICAVSGSVVSFTGAGTCTIDANQAGDANYEAAPQVQQSFVIAGKPPQLPATSPPPTGSSPGPAALATGAGGVLSYSAGLQSTKLPVSAAGVLIVKVRCLGTSSCAGTLTLRTLTPVLVAPGRRKTVLLLARGSFSLHAGQTKGFALRLAPSARRLLARVHVLRARAMILAKDATGATHATPLIVMLRAAKTHH